MKNQRDTVRRRYEGGIEKLACDAFDETEGAQCRRYPLFCPPRAGIKTQHCYAHLRHDSIAPVEWQRALQVQILRMHSISGEYFQGARLHGRRNRMFDFPFHFEFDSVDFEDARFYYVRFSGCSFVGNTNLKGVGFFDCLLDEATFRLPLLDQVKFERCDVQGMEICPQVLDSSPATRLQTCEFHYVVFKDIDLTGATLIAPHMTNCEFMCDLGAVKIEGGTFEDMDLVEHNPFAKALFSGAPVVFRNVEFSESFQETYDDLVKTNRVLYEKSVRFVPRNAGVGVDSLSSRLTSRAGEHESTELFDFRGEGWRVVRRAQRLETQPRRITASVPFGLAAFGLMISILGFGSGLAPVFVNILTIACVAGVGFAILRDAGRAKAVRSID